MSNESPTLEQMLHNARPPKWLLEMHDHYAKSRAFRIEDIVRVLGDPREGVNMPMSEEEAKAFFGFEDAGGDAGEGAPRDCGRPHGCAGEW